MIVYTRQCHLFMPFAWETPTISFHFQYAWGTESCGVLCKLRWTMGTLKQRNYFWNNVFVKFNNLRAISFSSLKEHLLHAAEFLSSSSYICCHGESYHFMLPATCSHFACDQNNNINKLFSSTLLSSSLSHIASYNNVKQEELLWFASFCRTPKQK